MDRILTAEEIAERPKVRFVRGHLKGHAEWTGTVTGYNDLYDTYTLYVDAPGNAETGSKITYGRTDVELLRSAKMTNTPTGKVTLHENAADVEPSNRGTIYRLDADNVTSYVTVKDALTVVNTAMTTGWEYVEEMTSQHGKHRIRYTGGTELHLFEVPAPVKAAATGPARPYSNGPTRTVTVKGKTYVVGTVVPAQTERRKISEHSYSLPHPAYVRYWSDRGGKAFGPTRDASGNSKPGTVGRAIWDAIQM